MLTRDSGTVKDAMLEKTGIVSVVFEVEAMARGRKGELRGPWTRHIH